MNEHLTPSELLCLRDVQTAADELAISIIAVGANARRLIFDAPHRIASHRHTNDWDFGVRVPDWPAFSELRRRLIGSTRLFGAGPHEHCIVHAKTNIRVDLVPFGGLEIDGHIRWPDSHLEMNVFGFSDACESAAELILAPNLRLKVATTPLLVALKIFALSDRFNTNDRDIGDLWHIVEHYLTDGQESRLADDPICDAIDDTFDFEHAGALLLGFDLGQACRRETVSRVLPIIDKLCDPYSPYIRPLLMSPYDTESEDQQRTQTAARFTWLRKGIKLANDAKP